MIGNIENISLLIIGYDPYIDVWKHYFDLLEKYWKDRPETFLATNVVNPNYPNVKTIPVGEDAEWSRKVQVALEHIKTKYVVLLLEDFFTTREVDNNTVDSLMASVIKGDIKYCKLLNESKIKGEIYGGNKHLHIIRKDEEYGISLQPAIWNVEYLREKVGKENYNAWIFEFNQVKNKGWNETKIDCIADDSNPLQITHAVVQSQYLRKAIRVFKSQGYEINTNTRKVMSLKDTFKYRLKNFANHTIPKKYHNCFKPFGRLLGIDFVSDRQNQK